jgi:iron-sulfur cluster repair protein YtfE (RIC family)
MRYARRRRFRPRETVRRHPALVPLSEEHHRELAHARRLLGAAGAGPGERLAVASAYVEAFFTETVEHFRSEEEILFPLHARHAGSTPLLERVLREHMELHGLVRALRVEAATGGIPPEALRTLGDLLHDHVRVEERELFAEIERIVPAAELERVRL